MAVTVLTFGIGTREMRDYARSMVEEAAKIELNRDETFKGTPLLTDAGVSGETVFYVKLAFNNKSKTQIPRYFNATVTLQDVIMYMHAELNNKIAAAAMAGVEMR